MKDLSFLIVEENTSDVWTLKTLLRAFGVRQIEECADGARACDAFQAATPEIVLLSDRLSPVKSFEIVKRLRDFDDSPDPYVPIILAGPQLDNARIRRARDAGVNEMIKKPVTATDLYRAIDAVVNRPRPFIRVASYFGPCRRRADAPYAYAGCDRRRSNVARAAGGMAPFAPFPHALSFAQTGRPGLLAAE